MKRGGGGKKEKCLLHFVIYRFQSTPTKSSSRCYSLYMKGGRTALCSAGIKAQIHTTNICQHSCIHCCDGTRPLTVPAEATAIRLQERNSDVTSSTTCFFSPKEKQAQDKLLQQQPCFAGVTQQHKLAVCRRFPVCRAAPGMGRALAGEGEVSPSLQSADCSLFSFQRELPRLCTWGSSERASTRAALELLPAQQLLSSTLPNSHAEIGEIRSVGSASGPQRGDEV